MKARPSSTTGSPQTARALRGVLQHLANAGIVFRAPGPACTMRSVRLARRQAAHEVAVPVRGAPRPPGPSRRPRSTRRGSPAAKRCEAAPSPPPARHPRPPRRRPELVAHLALDAVEDEHRALAKSSKVFVALANSAIVSTAAVATSTRPPMLSASSVRMPIGRRCGTRPRPHGDSSAGTSPRTLTRTRPPTPPASRGGPAETSGAYAGRPTLRCNPAGA